MQRKSTQRSFWVYKFKIKGTKLFYIGATSCIDSRKSAHINGIFKCFRDLKTGTVTNNNRRMYVKIATQLMSRKSTDSIDIKYIISKFKIEIIDIVDTPAEAAILEGGLLKIHVKSPHCLNTASISNY